MKKAVVSFILTGALTLLVAEAGRITITERSDYSVYIDGKYQGLTYRESYTYLDEQAITQNGRPAYRYVGEAFVLEETRKNMIGTAKKLDAIRPIAFTQQAPSAASTVRHAALQFEQDAGYPLLRNFPVSPDSMTALQESGKKWTAESVIVVAPRQGKKPTRIPIIAEYQSMGEKEYNGKPAHYIKAQFGTRYRGGDTLGDTDMTRSEGSRSVDIYLDEYGRPLFIREKIDETFFYADSGTVRNRGFLLHFYHYGDGTLYRGGSGPITAVAETSRRPVPPAAPIPPSTQAASNKERIKEKAGGSFDVRETARGLLLNIKNLNFIADRAQLLPNEDKKLDEIAAALKTLTFKTLFIEGHTADVGDKTTQYGLSVNRAKTVVDELVKRGIPADACIYSGAGGTKPIASNATEAERALNRRVEITVME